MVEVYCWAPKISGNIGHAAMKVNGGDPSGTLYLSRWPDPSVTGAVASVVSAYSGSTQPFADDVASEGGQPAVVRLTRLNEAAIKRTVARLNRASVYAFLWMNCATQVRMCLEAGLDATDRLLAASDWILPQDVGRWAFHNTPQGVYLWAAGLRGKYA
jgi:hypothetical protein